MMEQGAGRVKRYASDGSRQAPVLGYASWVRLGLEVGNSRA